MFARYVIEGRTVQIENDKGTVRVLVENKIVLCASVDEVRQNDVEWSAVVSAVYGGQIVTTFKWDQVTSEVIKFAHLSRGVMKAESMT